MRVRGEGGERGGGGDGNGGRKRCQIEAEKKIRAGSEEEAET